MFDFIKSLFKKKVKKDSLDKKQPEPYRDSIDYDGMGNQGRFPVSKKKGSRL